ncbi:hypothetical protein RJ639_040267 [Escallonia herrerae]|uniref:RRM domain-containing protein n=1 Tax=Escallonia herrerae TaxID=1293975 RepID=A0AA89B2E8_9ASTE|nr:hypothetical protein RJ639_040267 [Escallonia herrerae]
MEPIKKRKVEATLPPSGNPSLPSEQEMRSLLEPLAKTQLVDLLAKLGSQYPSIAEEIRGIASADPANRKLFVRGLAWDTTSNTLRAAFQEHGEIEEGAVILDKATGKSRGYGFITYKDMNSARAALEAPSKLIDGRMAVCNLACEGLSSVTSTPDLAQRKLYIGGLSPDTTSEMLLYFFGRHGEIEEGSVAYDKDTNKSRGFGFITYKTLEATKKAVEDPQKTLAGRNITVKLADNHKSKAVQAQLSAAMIQLPPMAAYPQPGQAHSSTPPLGYTYPPPLAAYPASVYPIPTSAAASYQTPPQISYPQYALKTDSLAPSQAPTPAMGSYPYYITKQ